MPSNALVLPLDLDKIDALANAATPGPWSYDNSGVFMRDGMGPIIDENRKRKGDAVGIGSVGDDYPRGDNHPTENMRFIAAARTLVPALVARVRELELDAKRLDWLESRFHRIANDHGGELVACFVVPEVFGINSHPSALRETIDDAMSPADALRKANATIEAERAE